MQLPPRTTKGRSKKSVWTKWVQQFPWLIPVIACIVFAFLIVGGLGVRRIIVRVQHPSADTQASDDGPEQGKAQTAPDLGANSKQTAKPPESKEKTDKEDRAFFEIPPPVAARNPGKSLDTLLGQPISAMALVSRPERLEGVKSWTVETRASRGMVQVVAYSHDGRLLAYGSYDGAIRIVEPQTGRLVKILLGHNGVVRSVKWSDNNQTLASMSFGDSGTEIRFWDVSTGKCNKVIRRESSMGSMACDSACERVAFWNGNRAVAILDVQTEEVLKSLKTESSWMTYFAWSPDERRLVAASKQGALEIWTLDGEPSHIVLPGHKGINGLAWSRDSGILATCGDDATVRLWDAESGKTIRTLREPSGARLLSIGWSVDHILATGSADRQVRIWNAATGTPMGVSSTGVGTHVNCVNFSEDGRWLAYSVFSLWHWDTRQEKPTVLVSCHDTTLRTAAFSFNGRKLAVGGRSPFVIWDLVGGHRALTDAQQSRWVDATSWAPGDRYVAVAMTGGVILIFNAQSLKPVRTLRANDSHLETIAWSPDGSRLATGGVDSVVRVWDPNSGRVVHTLRHHLKQVNHVAWSPDGTVIASGGDDGVACIWDAKSGELLRELKGGDDQPAPVRFVAWSPDGAVLACGGNRTIQLWDPIGGENLKTLSWPKGSGYIGYINSMAWSTDSKLFSVSQSGVAQRWNTETGKLLDRFTVPVGYILSHSIALPTTGRTAATVQGAGTVRFWDMDGGTPRGTIVRLRNGGYACITADGRIVQGSPGVEDMLVYVVQTDAGQQTLTPSQFRLRYQQK